MESIEMLDEVTAADEVSFCCFCLNIDDLDETTEADEVSFCCFCLEV